MDHQPSLLPDDDPVDDTAPGGDGTPEGDAADGTLRVRGAVPVADVLPVAAVLVETPLPQLARPFDYAVPAELDEQAQPGVRVRVRFAGRLISGFVVERRASTDHVGELAALHKVVSPLPVLTPDLLELTRAVADRYAGMLPDVLRLAIPARHARAEKSVLASPESRMSVVELAQIAAEIEPAGDEPPDFGAFVEALGKWVENEADDTGDGAENEADDGAEDDAGDEGGPDAVRAAAAEAHDAPEQDGGRPRGPRAAYALVPGSDPGTGWIGAGLRAASAVLAAGRTVLWLVPDHRELAALQARLDGLEPVTVRLSADEGPSERWSAWVAALTGRARLVIGTRAAAFAPLPDLGLIICVDDDDASYREQRAPYPHALAVLVSRTQLQRCALLLLDYGRSTEVQQLVSAGWARDVAVPRALRRSGSPIVLVPDPDGDPVDAGRLPPRAFEIVRAALGRTRTTPGTGPVLVQVPRAGYLPVVACARCRTVSTCPHCGEKIAAASAGGPYACRACGYTTDTLVCAQCSGTQVRSVVSGLERVHEELGRAFSGVPVLRSGGDRVLPDVPAVPSIVVATTGAEPYAPGGYAAALLLDTLWPGPGLRGTDRAIARRLRAAALVRSRDDGGRVLLLDEDEAVQRVLVRFDPVPWAAEQLADRTELGLPPAARTITLGGSRTAVAEVLAVLREVAEIRVLLESDDPYSLLAGCSLADGTAVTTRLAAETVSRAMRGAEIVSTRVDDPEAL